jgi:adenylate kinase
MRELIKLLNKVLLMRAILAGVPGAGKTSVLDIIKEKRKDIKVINIGDLMFEYAKKIGIKDRDEIRRMRIKEIEKLQKKVASYIGKIKDKNIIVDTHYSVKTKKGYLPGLNKEMLKLIKPDILILITAKPEDILERRKKDLKIRKRDIETIEQISDHEKINISYVVAYSTILHVPFLIVRNDNGMKKEDVAQNIISIFDD